MLDTGNVLNSENYKDYDRNYDLVMNSMNIMGYSAINLGNWDLYSSSRFVENTCKNDRIPLVSANVAFAKTVDSCIQKYFIKEINGIKIGITGITPQQYSFRPPDKRFSIIDPKAALNEIILDLDKKTDFIILLSQLRATETQKILENFSNIDLALCVDTLPTDLETLPTHKVMTIVNQGKQIGIVSIEKNNQAITIKNSRAILLDDDIDSDPVIQALISELHREKELQIQKQKNIETFENQKQVLQLTPEEFIKQYNNERKK